MSPSSVWHTRGGSCQGRREKRSMGERLKQQNMPVIKNIRVFIPMYSMHYCTVQQLKNNMSHLWFIMSTKILPRS